MKKRMILVLIICVLFISLICSVNAINVEQVKVNDFLAMMLEQEWTHDGVTKILGESDSFFEEYNIYSKMGINIKFSEIPVLEDNGIKGRCFNKTGDIENIIFGKKYTDEIVGGIRIGDKVSSAVEKIGSPDFADNELNVIGYKTEDFYVFINGKNKIDAVSIYPVQKEYDKSTLSEAVSLCENAEYTYETAVRVAELFEDKWPKYNYSFKIPKGVRISPKRGCVGIAYYCNGVKISYSADNNTDTPLISVYSNYSGTLPKNSRMVKRYPNTDLVFETEKERLIKRNSFKARIEREGKLSPDGKTLIVDNEDNSGIDVIFTDVRFPDYCLITSPYQYGAGEWLNNRYFVYSYGKGVIMIYDLLEEKSAQLSSEYASIEDIGKTYVILKQNSTEEACFEINFMIKQNGDIETVDAVLEWNDGVKENGCVE